MSYRDLHLLTKVLSIIVMVVGACFASVSGIMVDNIISGGNPITADLYGPEIYATPALVWVGAQSVAAVVMMVGAMLVASQSRWWGAGAVLIIVGGTWLSTLMITLVYYAANAPQGILIYSMCLGFGLPAAAISTAIGVAIIYLEWGGA